jgi:pilus assembly protein Flp/PilA
MVRDPKTLLARIWKNKRGATLLEYSVLIGLITATVVGAIVIVAGWTNTQWANLKTNLDKVDTSK